MQNINKKVPKLRFKEFSGEWVEKKLGEIGKVSMCKRVLKAQTDDLGEIPFYKIGTFGKQADAFITKELYNEYKSKYSYPLIGDILISASGTIGRTVVYDGKPAYYQDSNIVWIANNEKFVYNRFLLYCYSNVRWQTEDTTIARLYNDNLRGIKINLPTLPEQTKIADCLSTWDESIENLKLIIENKKLYKKAMMQKLFNGKLKVENGKCFFEEPSLRFKPSQAEIDHAIENGKLKIENGKLIASESTKENINYIATDDSPIVFNSQLSTFNYKDWVERKISSIFEITRGYVFAVTKMSDIKTDDCRYPVYSSQTKNNGLTGYFNEFLYKDSITWTTDGANAGDVNFRQGKFYCTNVCGVLKSEKGYANECIAQILNSVTKRYVSYVGNPKLMNNTMGSIKITIPSSLKEQTKIANFLSAIDDEIELLEQQLEQLQLQKKALMQGMFV